MIKEDLQCNLEFMNNLDLLKKLSLMNNIVLTILETIMWMNKKQNKWNRKNIRKKLKDKLQDYGKRSLMIVLYQLNKMQMQKKSYRSKLRIRKKKKCEKKKKKKNKKKKNKKKLLSQDQKFLQPDKSSLNSQLISEPK